MNKEIIDELIGKLEIWTTPGNQVNTEPAYFRDKVFPIVPDMVAAINAQRKEMDRMSRDVSQTIKTCKAESDNLRARVDTLAGENQQLKERLAERQPEINRLRSMIDAAKKALQ